MFLDSKKQYCENDCTTKCNLQIQCGPYQIISVIFHRTRTKKFTIHIETQKTPNSQSSLEKEEWSWRNQTFWLQTVLQSYSHQDSVVLAQKQKHRAMEQHSKPRDKPMHLWVYIGTLSLTKEEWTYNGEKIVSSTRGAGETWQLHIKEWN